MYISFISGEDAAFTYKLTSTIPALRRNTLLSKEISSSIGGGFVGPGGVTEGVEVGVTVGFLVGVTVGVFEGVLVGVAVGVSVGVFVGGFVGVSVGVFVGPSVGVFVGVSVGVFVTVFVGVFVGVDVFVGVAVLVGVAVFVGVLVGVDVFVDVGVGVLVKTPLSISNTSGIPSPLLSSLRPNAVDLTVTLQLVKLIGWDGLLFPPCISNLHDCPGSIF